MEISAKENIHLQELKDEFSNYVENLKTTESKCCYHQSKRHYEALQKSIETGLQSKDDTHQISTELLAYELRKFIGVSWGNTR